MSDADQMNLLKIFLCHSRQDKKMVIALYHKLKAEGFQPWLDREDIEPGEDWQLAIRKAVKVSDIFLVCLSPTAISSPGYVHKEIKFALDRYDELPEGTIFLIPLLLQEVDSEDLPVRLSRLHWVEYFEEDGYARLVRALHKQAKQRGKQVSPVKTDPASQPAATEKTILEKLLAELEEAKTKKDWDRAIEVGEQILKIAPNNEGVRKDTTFAYKSRGNVYRTRKQDDLALVDYNQAIKLDPNYAPAYGNRGNVYYARKQYKLALIEYNQAIKLDPNLALAYCSRGNVYYVMEQYDLALAEYDQSIKLDPNDASVYAKRGNVYLDKKQYDLALADYNQVIKLEPNYVDAYNNRGRVYYAMGQYDLALADYNQTLKLEPGYVHAYNNRGNVYADRNQYDLALADYKQALKFDPNYAITYYNRGLVYKATGDIPAAKRDFQKAVDLGFEDVKAELENLN
jgi:tetratricopeptide (TPR) repeat protein